MLSKAPFWFVLKQSDLYLPPLGNPLPQQRRARPFVSSEEARAHIPASSHHVRVVRVWAKLPKPDVPEWARARATPLDADQVDVWRRHQRGVAHRFVFRTPLEDESLWLLAVEFFDPKGQKFDSYFTNVSTAPQEVWVEAVLRAQAKRRTAPAPVFYGQWVIVPEGSPSDYEFGPWEPIPRPPTADRLSLGDAAARFFESVQPTEHVQKLVAVIQGPMEIAVFIRSSDWNGTPVTYSEWNWMRGGTMFCPAHPETGDHDFNDTCTGIYTEKPKHAAAKRGVKGWLECPRRRCKGWVEYDFGDGSSEAISEAVREMKTWKAPANPDQLTLPTSS